MTKYNPSDVLVSNWTLDTGTRPGERHVPGHVPEQRATFSAGSQVMSSRRTVVAVSGHPQRAELLDALLIEANDYDVIIVESIAHGYSRVKQVTPDLVIVYCEIDDVAACRLLSMLKIDGDMSGIPVVTRATRGEDREFEDIIAELDRDPSCQTLAIQMH
jgi:hypothetical protein